MQQTADSPTSQNPKVAPILSTITFVDKNGLTETISEKDRLKPFILIDYLTPQAYQKVLRVYSRDGEGKIRSILTTYHDNGQIRQYLEIINGRAQGQYKEWYASGHLKIESSLVEGKPDVDPISMESWAFDGLNKVYREDGSTEAEFTYLKGVLHGTATRYFPDGTIQSRTEYVGGSKEGLEEKYFPSGTLFERTNYIDGIKDGTSEGYHEDGSIAWKEKWNDGELDEASYSTKDGKLISSIHDGNGKKAYFEHGILKETREFLKGDEQGEVIQFDPSARTIAIYHIKNGKKEGIETRYFIDKAKKGESPELHPRLEIEWHNGILQGSVKTWYQSGQLESQREYMSNFKHGLSMAWYIDGSIMLIEEYEKDRLIRGEYRRRGENNPISRVENGKGTATIFDSHGALIKRIRYIDGQPEED